MVKKLLSRMWWFRVKKHGKSRGKQRYKCSYCSKIFTTKSSFPCWLKNAYNDYTFKRVTLNDVAKK